MQNFTQTKRRTIFPTSISNSEERYEITAAYGYGIAYFLIFAADMERKDKVLQYLDGLGVRYECYSHPATPTIEQARVYWRDDGSMHCKNLFLRNHKGDRHYLVCFDCGHDMDIHDMERRLHQGKLSFASPRRMELYLGVEPGSVSPFGLINDERHAVHLFLDKALESAPSMSFHPNDCRYTVVLERSDFMRYLLSTGNTFEFTDLY